MVNPLLLLALLCATFPHISNGMAQWMTKEECGKVLRLGEIIMGSEAKFSAKRTIRVYRDEGRTMLDSGTEYIPGEMLLVVLFGPEERGIQFVFEAENAVFEKGGCDGKRIANVKVAKLIAPESSEEENDVHVIAGWSLGYGTVKITPPFLLVHPSSKVAVTKESQDEPPENSNHNNQEKLVNSNLQEAIKAAPIKLNLRTKATTEKVHEPVRAPPSRPKRHLDPTKLSFGTPSMTEEVKADTPHSLAAQPVVLKLPDKTMSAEAAVEKQNDQPPVQAETELVKQQQDIATQTENKPNHPPTAVVPTTETREGGQQHAGEREPETDTPAVHNAEKIKVEKVILLQQPKRTQEEGGGRGGGGAVIAEIPEAEALKQALAKIEELSESIKELKGAQNKNRNDNSAGGDSADGIPETEGAVPVENLASPGRAEHHEVVKGKKKGNTGERLRRNKKDGPSAMDKRKEILTAGGRHKTTSSRTHDGEDSENSKGKPRFDPYLENGQSNDHVYPHSRRGQQSSMQLVLFTVGIVSCLLLAIAAVVLCVYCCISHQEGVNRMLDRVLRRKQGQDKE